MTTVKHKHHHSDYNLSADVEKIKAALLEATLDVKGKAGELLLDSIDGVKERSENVKQHVMDYTADKPFKSLGMALIAGIAIGYFLRKS